MNQLDKFKLYLKRRGNKQSSIAAKLKLINRLKIENPSFERKGFNIFVSKLKEQDKVISYINSFIITIRLWGKCFKVRELAGFHRLRGNNSNFKKEFLTDDEINAFLSLPYEGQGGRYEERYNMWTIFFYILAYTGARPMEVASLKVYDLDFVRNVFYFRKTKKESPRIVPISPAIKNKLEEYAKSLKDGYLFPNYIGTKNKPHADWFSWRYPFDERIKRLGGEKDNLSTSSLRHSFITRQVDEDVSVFKIQKLVGHKQIESTARYVHLSEQALRDTIANDRLAKSNKAGIEIIDEVVDYLKKIEDQYKNIVIKVKKNKSGEEITINLVVL